MTEAHGNSTDSIGVRLEASAATEIPMVKNSTVSTMAGALHEQNEGEAREYTEEFEDYNENDARTMSPRRSVTELDKVGSEAKAALEEYIRLRPIFPMATPLLNSSSRQAKALQSGLLALLERVDKVKEEHQKLEAENRFLQEYVLFFFIPGLVATADGVIYWIDILAA